MFIKKDLHAGDFAQQAIVSSLLLGAMLGAVISGSVYVIGAPGYPFSINAPMLVGFRFLLGISVGTASFVAPLNISEVSPPKVRGGLVSFNQLAVTSGILIAYIVNFLLKDVTNNWHRMLGLAALPGAALAVGMLSVPHTPRWLVQKQRDDKAHGVLERLRDSDPAADVDNELHTITETSKEEGSSRVRDLLAPKVRPLMVIGLGLALFQQFVGINTVIHYAPTILADTGLTNSSSITQTVFVGITNVVFTVVAVLLLDRVGRRKLLLTGTVGMVLSLILLGIYFPSSTLQSQAGYLALVALLVYIISFAIGLAPVFWLMISEIYPVGIRSKTMSRDQRPTPPSAKRRGCPFRILASTPVLAAALAVVNRKTELARRR